MGVWPSKGNWANDIVSSKIATRVMARDSRKRRKANAAEFHLVGVSSPVISERRAVLPFQKHCIRILQLSAQPDGTHRADKHRTAASALPSVSWNLLDIGSKLASKRSKSYTRFAVPQQR